MTLFRNDCSSASVSTLFTHELPIRRASTNSDPDKPPELSDLLPDAWLKAYSEHRWEIDDIRKVERDRSRQQKISKRPAQGS